MAHRGPDGRATKSLRGGVLGHNRLKILDLSSAGSQPMVSHSGRYLISFNGEIYNHRDLRDSFGQTIKWHGHSDTEVLLEAFARDGLDLLQKLEGIFAFAIWDKKTETLTLVRDHFGVKPVYYWQQKGTLIFASELGGVLASGLVSKDLNPEAIHHLLSIQAVPAPLSMMTGVNLLPLGSYLTWRKGRSAIHEYYRLNFIEDDGLGASSQPYIARTRALLETAVRSQQQADVPLGVALSGGIDSSAITVLLSGAHQEQLLTYSLRSDDVFGDRTLDEIGYARIVAKQAGTQHSEVALRRLFFLAHLPQAVSAQGQPSLRSILAYFLFRDIKQQAKVVFYGTGGDELFAGYGTAQILEEVRRKGRFINLAPNLIRRLLRSSPRLARRFPEADNTFALLEAGSLYRQRQLIDWTFLDREKATLYHPSFAKTCRDMSSHDYFLSFAAGRNPLKIHQHLDWLGIAAEHLNQLDAVSMANSIEARVPFLDRRLVEFAASLPGEILAPGGEDHKFLLRQSLRDVLPPEILTREKQGFNIGLADYLKPSFRALCERYLLDGRLTDRKIFSARALRGLVDRGRRSDLTRERRLFEQLFFLLIIAWWLEIFVDGRDTQEISNEILYLDSHAPKEMN
jgi:asparagine synthase (glutamine-hydrolysing)